MSDAKKLTASAGAPLADNQNALSAGLRGPVLMQDYQLIEKLAHQNREGIHEGVLHTKGYLLKLITKRDGKERHNDRKTI